MKLKPKVIIKGNTVYELNNVTHTPRRIIHGVDKYFKLQHEREDDNAEDQEEFDYHNDLYEPDEPVPADVRHKQIANLIGNKKKLVSKADGLNKEIPIDESGNDPLPYKMKPINNRYRKKKPIKTKSKRKVVKHKNKGKK